MDETRLAEAIVEALQKGIQTRTTAEDAKRAQEANDALLRLSKTIKQATKDTGFFSSVIKNQKVPYKDISDELKKLDEQISKTTKKTEKDNLMWEKSQIAKANSEANANAANINFALGLTKATIALGQIAAGGAGTFVKNLQSGASSIDVAAGIMTAGVDVANSGLQAAAGGASGMGEALMHGGKKARLFGLGLMAAGTALSFFSESASKLAKFGIEVLSAELKKSVESFMTMSASGALFTNGVQGMRDASLAAGLTINQFSKVVQENSSTLAGSGLGVTGGIKKVGAALKAGGDSMQRNLLNLGYSLEEQAGLVAETMQDMRQSGGPLKATDTQIAAETQKYAENLRIISAITGEDAKQRMARVRDQASQLGFQQKLAGMDENQRKGVISAMGNMSELERKNFMDMVMFGSVINKEGAAAAAMSQGLTDSVTSSYKSFQAGKLDENEQRRINGQYTDQIKNDMLKQSDIGMAGMAGIGGFVTDLSKVMGDELKFRNSWTAEAQAQAEKNAKGQETTKDELTNDLMKALQASQKMALDLQSAMDPLIKGYASVTAAMLESIKTTFAEIAKEIHDRGGSTGKGADASGGSTWDRVKAGALSGAEDGAVFGAKAGAGVGFVAGGIGGTAILPGAGTIGGAVMGASGGASTGGIIGTVIGGISGAIEGFFSNPKNTRLDGTGKRYGAAAEPSNKILLIHEGERVLNKLETDEYNKGLATPSRTITLANEQAQTPFKEFFTSLSDAGASLQNFLSSGANKLSDILNKDINIKVESMMPPGFTDFAPQLKTIFDQMNSAEMSRSNNAEVTKSAIDQLTTIGKSIDQQSLGQNTQLQGIVNQLLDAVKLPNAQFADQSSQIKTSIDQLITAVKLPNGQNTQVADQASLIKTSMDQLTSAVNLPNAQFANQTSDIKSLITQLIGSVNTPNVQFTDQAAQLKSSIDQLTTSVKLPNGQDKQFADQASQIKTSIDQLIGSANLPTAQVATQVGQIKTSIDQLIGSVKTPDAQFTDQAAQLKSSIDQMSSAIKLPTAQFADQTTQLKSSIDSFGNNTKADTAQTTSLMSQMETTMGQLLNFSSTASKQSSDQATQFQTLTDKMFNSVMSANQPDLGSTSIQKTFDQMLALSASTDKNTSQLLLTNQDSPNQINKSFDSISKSLIVDSNQQLDGALSRMIGELRDKNVQAEKTTQAQPKSLTNEPISAPIGSDQQQLLELVSKQLLAMETSISKTDNLINLLTEGNNNTRQLLNAAY